MLWSALQPQKLREASGDRGAHVMVKMLAGGKKKIVRMDAAVIVVVTAMAVILDLATAVLAGIVLSALSFAWSQSHALDVTTTVVTRGATEMQTLRSFREVADEASSSDIDNINEGKEDNGNDDAAAPAAELGGVLVKVYSISGPIFFSSVSEFKHIFDVRGDPDHVEVHLHNAQICDFSGLEAINSVAEQYHKLGKTLLLRHLSPRTAKMMRKAHSLVTQNLVLTVSSAAKPQPAHHLHVESRWS